MRATRFKRQLLTRSRHVLHVERAALGSEYMQNRLALLQTESVPLVKVTPTYRTTLIYRQLVRPTQIATPWAV